MHTFIHPPSLPLAPYIAQYWHWKLPKGTAIPTIYSGTGVECAFNLGEPIEVVQPYSSIISKGSGVILCPRKQHFRATGSGDINLLSIRFRSAGFFRLFKIPLTELADELIDLGNIFPKSLFEQLLDEQKKCSSVTLLERHLLPQLNKVVEEKLMNYLVDKIYYQKNIKLQTIINNSVMSERAFQRRFKIYTGVSGKYFQRTARFQSCIKALLATPKLNFSQLALTHGYFDQAHLINEFKFFSTVTPQHFVLNKQEGVSHY
jgi:AraC-like DNA-binding protein